MTTTVFVYTMTKTGKVGAWSRYTFPFSVDSYAQLGNALYIRHGDEISVVSESATSDDVGGVAINFTGTVWWPWLDFGSPGGTKMLEYVDVVAEGTPSLSIGYDQRNVAAFTAPYTIDADTYAGGPIPMPVAAPSLSVRLDFAGGQQWSLSAVNLSLFDLGSPP